MASSSDPLSSTPSQPVPISASPEGSRGRASPGASVSRMTSTARLASPVPSSGQPGSPWLRQVPTPGQLESSQPGTPPPGIDGSSPTPGPGQSALAAAFRNNLGGVGMSRSPSRFSTPPIRSTSPSAAIHPSGPHSTYGSFDTRSAHFGLTGLPPLENPEVVRRHLVQPSNLSTAHRHGGVLDVFNQDPSGLRGESSSPAPIDDIAPGLDEDEFSSLRLQGGDITRQVYRWTEEAEAQSRGRGRAQRSKSFHVSRPEPESDILDINSIKVPGGFRRNYLRRAADEQSPASSAAGRGLNGGGYQGTRPQPRLLTNNFIEFLSLYGHFAGEELEEDDEVLLPDEYFSSDNYDDGMRGLFEGGEDEESREPGEDSALLDPGTPGKRKRRRKSRGGSGKNGSMGAVLLLLKSFVGTGVLFLPKAYKNGGMLFSNLVLLGVASLSYYCFILLVKTRIKIDGSFGDIGGILYGPRMRSIILFSIVLSQIGFAAAYIVFTSEGLQAFILAVSDCRRWIDIKFLILMQLIVFLPLSLIRDISKLGATALIADGLILLGLVYLYYYDIFTIVRQGGVSDIVNFNPNDWTLFIGTAIFTFEGIGLIIPIQESMKKQEKFPPVLGGVMVIITTVFVSMGALGYAAYGSSTKTVVILNLPQDDKFVNGVQFMYSLAILLSTPLQLFPAIRITENALFTRSGKYNPYIKWQKNAYRFFLVMMTAGIAWFGANDLDKFVALVGSFACVPLVYVYPPMLHFKAVARTRFHRWTDVALVIFGFIVMIYTTSLTVKSWATKTTVKTPGYCDM
ncbi:MAG: neutral amino acid transporter [Geoglossum umbratile]|nr:MAG: neutral amino acid transporter [Geoglossum umbratile]